MSQTERIRELERALKYEKATLRNALIERDQARAETTKLDLLVSEFCKAVGEPIPEDAIALARKLSCGPDKPAEKVEEEAMNHPARRGVPEPKALAYLANKAGTKAWKAGEPVGGYTDSADWPLPEVEVATDTQARERVREALNLYRQVIIDQQSEAEGSGELEDLVVTLTQIESAKRVLWMEN